MAAVEAGIARFVCAATRFVATGRLEFAGLAILNPPQREMELEGTDGSIGGRQATVARVEAGLGSMASARAEGEGQHLKAKGVLRHATVKQLITD